MQVADIYSLKCFRLSASFSALPASVIPGFRKASEQRERLLFLIPGTQKIIDANFPGSRILRKSKPRIESGVSFSKFRDDAQGFLTHMLSQIGYDVTSPVHALTAFQRHFQPHKVDGIADQETYSLLRGLV